MSANKEMSFGIFCLNTKCSWKTDAEVIRDELEQVIAADRLGFQAAWVAEHNARPYGIVSSSPVFLAAASSQTKQIRLGTGVVRAPLYHPIRLAEELALLDIVSNGRLNIGVGRGYDPVEFKAYNVDFNEKDERHFESLEILQLALRNDTVAYSGKFYEIDEVKMYPQPVQKPMPPIYIMTSTASPSNSSIINAAKQGNGFIIARAHDYSVIREKVDLYRETALAAGHSPEKVEEVISRSGCSFYVNVDKDSDKAKEEYKKGYQEFMRLRGTRGNVLWSENVDYQKFLNDKNTLIGTPEEVTKGIKEFQEATGLGQITCWFNIGGQVQDQVLKSMELFAKEVIPSFQKVPSAR